MLLSNSPERTYRTELDRLGGIAVNRSQSRVLLAERVAGSSIIAPRRNNIAHLHRPWRASKIRHISNFG
jgi:hypothetical protein